MTGAGTVRRRVEVTGQVQGVLFRDTARTEAARRGVAGWVRNRSDGSLEAVFEGARDAVEAMVDWARTGPAYARVETVEVHEEPPEGLDGFELRSS